MTTHPTLILHAAAPIPVPVLQRLSRLLAVRCGPCRIVQTHGHPAGEAQRYTNRITYHLTGTWQLTPTAVHQHLIAVLEEFTP